MERGYSPGRFSFNVKGGRCEECQGEGVITTQLYFMPDVEVTCAVCKGARFNAETLDVTLRGKTITDILNMSVEEGVTFFASEPAIGKKIEVLNDLGLGYLTLGPSATTLSGGEAQRIKIAAELCKLQRRSTRSTFSMSRRPGCTWPTSNACSSASTGWWTPAYRDRDRASHGRDQDRGLCDRPRAGGGHAGGEIVVKGTPEEVAACKKSWTGRYLRARLRA